MSSEEHSWAISYREMESKGQDWERMEERCPVETSVGTLVWVRRRNGHWWPGRVLAAHEVPRSHLLVPKSGTPVKLLGKDDASVDWYNLGKSRRIKAFRCGEFDDCIERARSFGTLRSKNREKYARRDDAILHALELERMQAEGRQRSERLFSIGAVMGLPDLPKYMAITDDIRGRNHQKGNVDTVLSSDATMGTFSFSQATRAFKSRNVPNKLESSTTLEWENGTTEAIPRMRDLQDIGLATSKGNNTKCRNVLEALTVEDGIGTLRGRRMVYKTVPEGGFVEDGNNKMESCITRITPGVCSAPSITKVSSVTVQKRKKRPASSSADESSYKKRDRRRPLTQVMKNSSNKVVCSGGGSSALPSSTANCHMRMYWSDGTEATSSQEPFQQAANEFRPCSEPRDFDLLQGVHQSSYGMKPEGCKPLADSDRAISSFWPNYWEGSRWPSLVTTQMDFGLLLGSAFADFAYEGPKPASRFPGMACTGSATSANTPNFEKSDSLKYLHQGGINLSSSVGHNTCSSKNKGINGEKKEMHESDLGHVGLCSPGGQSVSKWQVKRRRNARKTSHCLRTEQHEDIDFSKTGDIIQDLERDSEHTHTRIFSGRSTYMRPVSQKKVKLWVSYSDSPSRSIRSDWDIRKSRLQQVCCVRRIPKSRSLSCDSQTQGFCWVDVRVEFCEPNRKESGQLMSLYSEVMNRVVLGYPVSVQILETRVKYNAPSTSTWTRSKLEVSGRVNTTGVPRCPLRNTLNQRRSLKTDAVRNGGRRHRRRKSTRKSGSMLQKTRMLSSLAGDECKVRTELEERYENHGAVPSDVSKGPLVTCIPVHVVFHRIREVLYKQPDHILNKS